MPLIEVHMLEGRSEEQKKVIDGTTSLAKTPIRVWIQEFSSKEFMVAGELAKRKL